MKMKKVTALAHAFFCILLFSASITLLFNVPFVPTAIVMTAVSFIPMPGGVLSATVFREVWTGEMLKYLTASDKQDFLMGIPDYSKYVANVGDEMQVIHLVAMGVLPDVLINNTTYPIPLQTIGENDVPIALDKYQTKRTPITDDELFALSYKKMSAIIERHGLAIKIVKTKKSIHALAPSGNTAAMPVLLTTGADDGTGRKKLTWDDVTALKRKLDNLEYPEDDRRLVLCSDHVNDLITSDQRFTNQYYNRVDGKPYNQLGFEMMDYVSNPYYTPGTKVKLSFGAVPAGTDRRASVFFCKNRTAKANGWTKMYYKPATISPDTQQNEINFRHYWIVLPTEEAARGAIVSDNA